MIFGLWLMAAGQLASGYAPTLAVLLASRVIQGIGFGLMIAPPGALVMQWFGEHEWPWINTINWIGTYVALTVVFAITVPIFDALDSSWRATMIAYGVAVGGVALLWTILGREHTPATPSHEIASSAPSASALIDVLKMRGVVLVAISTFGGMWVYQMYAAFLPQFFHAYHGLGLKESSALTAFLPLASIFGVAGGGFASSALGLRKPFTWPPALLMLAGGLGIMTASSIPAIRVSLILFGLGTAASPPAVTTLLMELPGMTPVKVGIGLSLVWGAGYVGAFASPFLGGALAGAFGLRAVMLGFLAFQSLQIIPLCLLPETGPGRVVVGVPAATEES
jgi:MFS family permease